jgi:hypothetical protein
MEKGREEKMLTRVAATTERDTAPFAGRIYVPGTPVFDRIGFWIGIVDNASVEAGALIMRPNWFARERIPLPPESIVLSESDGVYLNIHSPTLAEWR